jgi:tetratricopeptide (TPR) repeat protein
MSSFQFLVSFCNIGTLDSRFSLGLFVSDDDGIREVGYIDLDRFIRDGALFGGITGLCWSGTTIYAGLQGRPCQLLAFTAQRAPRLVPLRLVTDIHSMAALPDGRLLIVSTGNDSLVTFDPKTEIEELHTLVGDDRKDGLHVNGVALHDGRVIVSMFGARSEGLIRSGEVRDLTSGATLMSGLRSPHSVLSHGGAVFVLESETGMLMCRDPAGVGEAVDQFVGYTRGLQMGTNVTLVGRSAYRIHSASFGRKRKHPLGLDHNRRESATCCIYMQGPSDRSFAFDLTEHAPEIYDILILEPDAAAALAMPLIPAPLVRLRKAIRRNDLESAEAELSRLDQADHALALAAVEELRGDLPAAIQAVTTSIGSASDATPHIRLTRLYRRARRGEEALTAARRAAEIQPQAATLHLAQATIAQRSGLAAEALDALRRAMALAPQGQAIMLRMAELLAAIDEKDEATAWAVRVLERENSMANRIEAAGILVTCGRAAQARALIADERPAPRYRGAVLYLQSRIEMLEGDHRAALEAARKAVAAEPAEARYHAHLVPLLLDAGRADEAEASLKFLEGSSNPSDARIGRKLRVAARKRPLPTA